MKIAAILLICCARPLLGAPLPSFRADTGLVIVPVTVTDTRGAHVNGLRSKSFTVFENGRRQPIAAFQLEDAPCSIGIVLDVSGSMRNALERAKAAVHAFVAFSNPDDDYFLVTASSAPDGGDSPITDASGLEDRVRSQQPGGSTALVDTLNLAVHRLRTARHKRRALFVVSDGMDNHSRFTKSELSRLISESDLQIYTLGVQSLNAGSKPVEVAEQLRGLAFLEDLAATTGGLSLRLEAHREQTSAASTISQAIRNQYMIGYISPDAAPAGQWRRIQVKVNLRKVNVYARTGYWRE